MRRALFLVLGLSAFLTYQTADAKYVSGYYRSNGTYVNGYYRSDPGTTSGTSSYGLGVTPTYTTPKSKPHSTKKSESSAYEHNWTKPPTYKVGSTTYSYTQAYKTTGLPKVVRSRSIVRQFLKFMGFTKEPA
ncbi:MAG: hypothetical protein NT090_04180, partial [Acidobacteria bacterium]|nr:hypothetical protein [Acidobacteriota bacterium]